MQLQSHLPLFSHFIMNKITFIIDYLHVQRTLINTDIDVILKTSAMYSILLYTAGQHTELKKTLGKRRRTEREKYLMDLESSCLTGLWKLNLTEGDNLSFEGK